MTDLSAATKQMAHNAGDPGPLDDKDHASILAGMKTPLKELAIEGKTDAECADALNAPRTVVTTIAAVPAVLDEQGAVVTPAVEGSETVEIVGPSRYVELIVGVPFAPNAITAADVAAAKGA